MKKLLLSFMACFAALSSFGQASALYITGDCTSPTWSATNSIAIPKASDSNTYTYTFPTNKAPQFKISTVQADWNSGFNANCLYVGNITIGTKQKAGSGDGNNVIATVGDYTLTVTYESGAYYFLVTTATGEIPEYEAPSKVYIKGTINDWNGTDATSLTLTNQEADTNGNYTYEGTLATLSGNFKIGQDAGAADWTGLINFGGNDNPTNVPVNQLVNLAYNGNDLKVDGTYSDVKITFVFNPNTDTQTSTLFIQSESGPSYPDNLYLIGNVGEYSWNPTEGIPTTGTDGVYTFSNIKVTSSDGDYGFFGFTSQLSSDSGDWNTMNAGRYGAQNENQLVTTGDSDIQMVSGQNSWKILAGTYTFTVDLTTNTFSITGDADQVTYPDNLYLIGNVGEYSWNPTEGIMNTGGSDGVYTFSDIKVYNDNDGYGYFGFTGALGNDENDWDTLNAGRYGAGEKDLLVAAGESDIQMVRGENSWMILAGTYSFTVDLNDNTLSITGNADTPVTPPTPETYPDNLYFLGDVYAFNGNIVNENWDPEQPLEFSASANEDGVFTLTGVQLKGDGNGQAWFSFLNTKGSWDYLNSLDTPWRYGYVNDSNVSVNEETAFALLPSGTEKAFVIDGLAVYDFTVNFNTWEFIVTPSEVEYIEPAPYVPTVIYFKGSFNNWGNDGIAADELEAVGNGLYSGSVNIPASESTIEFKLDCGEGYWYGALDSEATVELENDVELTLELSATGDNWTLAGWDGGTVVVTVDWNNKTMTLLGSTEGEGEDGISSLENVDGAEVIYNLQGVRVNNPSNGLYIINGKKVIVK